MAIKIKRTLILFLLINHSFGYSQEDLRNDFGLLISTENNSKLAFEYRKAKNEQFLWKMGLTYYASNSGLGESEIFYASDSLVTMRNIHHQTVMGGLRFGFDKQIKSSYFYWGGDLNVNLLQKKTTFRNNNYSLNEMGIWENQNLYFDGSDNPDPVYAFLNEFFLHTSLRGHLSMNIPLGKSSLLVLSYSCGMGVPLFMAEKTKIDPLDEFGNRSGYTFDLYSALGAGLRYQIPKK